MWARQCVFNVKYSCYSLVAVTENVEPESTSLTKQLQLQTSPQSPSHPSALYAISPCDILTAVAAPAVAVRSSLEAAQSTDEVTGSKVKRVSSLVTSANPPAYVTFEDADSMPPKTC